MGKSRTAPTKRKSAKTTRAKNPVAVAFAKLRTAALSPKRRSEIARKAATARWGKAKPAKDTGAT